MVIPLALMCASLFATSVDYEIVPTDLGFLWIVFWLPVAMCLGASLDEARQPLAADRPRADAVRPNAATAAGES